MPRRNNVRIVIYVGVAIILLLYFSSFGTAPPRNFRLRDEDETADDLRWRDAPQQPLGPDRVPHANDEPDAAPPPVREPMPAEDVFKGAEDKTGLGQQWRGRPAEEDGQGTGSDTPGRVAPPSMGGKQPGTAGMETIGHHYPFPPFMPEERDQADREMMKTVQNMMIHAWDSYYKTAAGADELKPVSGGKHNWYGETSVLSTPIDAMDTLRMMGLDSRYEQAKGLVLKNLDFDIDVEVNLFETTIRVLGGLLSAWEFDDDPRYLKLAEDLADRMMGAFDTPTGLPLNFFNLKHKNASGHGTTLSQAGTLQLELQYLSDVTGNAKYAEKALKVYDIMHSAGFAIKGLYPIEWSTDNIDGIKNGAGQRYGLGANSDSFYEYMLKVWMATGEEKYREWYDESAEALKTHLVERKGDRVFVPDARYASTEAVHKVDSIHHLTCFAGGMFSTGALTRRRSYWTAFLDIGRSITHTCWEAYKRTPTGLGPDEWVMDTMVAKDTNYFLRPETIESIFYMWRFTHDETYREMGRAFAASLNKHCKLANGFSGLLDVSSKGPANHRDLQESFFLAETLKYLYLLFADDDTIPLEAFVFNTEGHPLSMRGWGRRKGLKRGSSGVGAGKKGIRDVENKAKEAKLQKIDVSGLAFEAKGVGSKESTGPANLASGDPSLEVSA